MKLQLKLEPVTRETPDYVARIKAQSEQLSAFTTEILSTGSLRDCEALSLLLDAAIESYVDAGWVRQCESCDRIGMAVDVVARHPNEECLCDWCADMRSSTKASDEADYLYWRQS